MTISHWVSRPAFGSGASSGKHLGRLADQTGAVAAALLLAVAAALPSDDDIANSVVTAQATSKMSSSAAMPELSFGGYLGAPYHYPSDFHLVKPGSTDLTIKQVPWYTEPFQHPLYYGFRLLRWSSNGRTGSMIDFTHSKAFAPFADESMFEGTLGGQAMPPKGKIGDYFKKLEFTHGHNMLTVNGLIKLARIAPRLQTYAGIGAGISLPHSELHPKTEPARTYEYQYTGPAAQALLGIEFRLARGSIFLEYKFTAAAYEAPLSGRDGTWLPIDLWRQFSRWWSGQPPPGGFASATLVSHQAIGGFTVRFSPTAR